MFGKGLDQGRLRMCPRCGCGLLPPSVVCQYCGAVLSHLAIVGAGVSAIVCSFCGTQNNEEAVNCNSCGAVLEISCPRCDALVPVEATVCAKCGLAKNDRYGESLRNERAGAKLSARTRRRAELGGNISALATIGGLVLLGLLQRQNQDGSIWKIWLILAAILLLMWLMTKTGNKSNGRMS